MKVESVTPTDAAASPSHPDHARWVKAKTLAVEVEHAKRLGLPESHAVNENNRLLQRMDALARDERPITAPSVNSRIVVDADRREWDQRRAAANGVIRRRPKDVSAANVSPCGRCGTCRACMRERRVQVICKRALKQDVACVALVTKLVKTVTDANTARGRFESMTPRDRVRAVERVAEDICDATIPAMGEWR